jgi:hypothetical protein
MQALRRSQLARLQSSRQQRTRTPDRRVSRTAGLTTQPMLRSSGA